jgi:hypothetical protein
MQSDASQIVRMALRQAQSFGAASLAGLAAAAGDRGKSLSEAQAREALAHGGAEFLDGDWFWLPGRPRSRLCTLTCRILAVTSPLDVATIRAGVCRTYPRSHAALVPPADVMDAFYNANPRFAVDAQRRIRSAGLLDYTTELSKTDRVFVEALRSSWTGILDDVSFHDACTARGMTTRTFNVRIAQSAVLDRPAGDIWCLRGTRISAITAAALRHARGVIDA